MVEEITTKKQSRLEEADVKKAQDRAAAVARAAQGPVIPVFIRGANPNYWAPEYTHVRRGSRVAFINLTDGNISIQFQHRHVFGLHNIMHMPVSNADPDQATSIQRADVRSDVFVGHYPFSVYCHEGSLFAEAGSMPIIIVDDD
jgi:hypothetical protein